MVQSQMGAGSGEQGANQVHTASEVWGACEVTLEGGCWDILLVVEVPSVNECMF